MKMLKFFTRISALSILLIFIFSLNILPQDITVKKYTANKGLPDSKIMSVVQDDKGVMWFTSENGVLSYDGNRWNIELSFGEMENTSIVSKIVKSEIGKLWVFCNYKRGKIFYREMNEWIELPIPDSIKSSTNLEYFSLIHDEGKDYILIGGINYGIYIYDGNWQKLDEKIFRDNPGIKIFNVKNDQNNFLVFTNHKAFSINLSGEVITPKYLNYQNLSAVVNITTLNSKNTRWILGRNWLGIVDGKRKLKILKKFKFTLSESWNYYFLSDAEPPFIYFGNRIVVYRYDKINNKLRVLSKQVGLITDGGTDVCIDREYNVWLSSLRGINKLRSTPFKNYYLKNGLLDDEVTAINWENSGIAILGHNSGLSYGRNNKFLKVRFSRLGKYSENFLRVVDIFKSSKGKIWLSSQHNGVALMKSKNEFVWYRNQNITSYYGIGEDYDNQILLASGEGLYKIFNNRLLKDKRVKDNPVCRSILKLRNGKLLISTSNGVYLLDRNSTKNFRSDNISGNNVFSSFETQNEILIGTAGGLFKIDGDRIVSFNNSILKINSGVYFITQDKLKNLWFGTDDGVVKFDGYRQRTYTIDDGLAGFEVNRSAGRVDKNGNLWIGTNQGLSIYNEEYDHDYKIKPLIYFAGIIDDENNKFDISKPIELSSTNNSFRLDFVGLSFINEEKLLYKIFIKYENDNWSLFSEAKENFIKLTNLSPGTYRFSAQVRNSKGLWSEKIESKTIKINQPFYSTVWFYAISLIIIGLITYSIQDYYTQRSFNKKLVKEVDRRTSELEKSRNEIRSLTQKLITTQDNERNKISRDLHDVVAQDLNAIKLYLNPFNNSAIKMNSEVTEKISYLNSLLDESIRYIRNLSYDLKPPGIEELGLFEAIKNYCINYEKVNKIKVNLDLDIMENLSFQENTASNIFRIVQEAMNNILKHANASNIIIHFSLSMSELLLNIFDDGIGFSYEEHKTKNVKGKKMGLRSMLERVKILNGTMVIKKNNPKGTGIYIKIPLKNI